jgi:hypothetical protein
MRKQNKPLFIKKRHVLPLLGNEANEWHDKTFGNSSRSIPSSNSASRFFVKSNLISHGLVKSKCLQQPMCKSDG